MSSSCSVDVSCCLMAIFICGIAVALRPADQPWSQSLCMEPSFLPNLQTFISSTDSDRICSTASTAGAAHSLVTKVGLICTIISSSTCLLSPLTGLETVVCFCRKQQAARMSTQQRPRAEQSELEVPLASIPQERLQLLAAERYSTGPVYFSRCLIQPLIRDQPGSHEVCHNVKLRLSRRSFQVYLGRMCTASLGIISLFNC